MPRARDHLNRRDRDSLDFHRTARCLACQLNQEVAGGGPQGRLQGFLALVKRGRGPGEVGHLVRVGLARRHRGPVGRKGAGRVTDPDLLEVGHRDLEGVDDVSVPGPVRPSASPRTNTRWPRNR